LLKYPFYNIGNRRTDKRTDGRTVRDSRTLCLLAVQTGACINLVWCGNKTKIVKQIQNQSYLSSYQCPGHGVFL